MNLDSLTEQRTQGFARNNDLEVLLKELNSLLSFAEANIVSEYEAPAFPMIFIMGPHRSGTTLLMQWLANTGLIAYPTNLLSRFYEAPIIGAKTQLLLTDSRYNFRDELGEFAQKTAYKSENGKTKGVLAPNEFWYFWRRFLPAPGRDVWTDEELRTSMDTQSMLAELAGMMDVFQKPFAAKGLLFNYNIPFLDSIFDKAVFIQIKRDPVTNVASVLEARKHQLGSEASWYSFKIPEYEELKNLDPITQAAGQIHYINKAVSEGMAKVADQRKIIVQYEDFCANPHIVFQQIFEKLDLNIDLDYGDKSQFILSRYDDLADREIIEALARFDAK